MRYELSSNALLLLLSLRLISVIFIIYPLRMYEATCLV